ncbi:hypothetical protein [Bosea sp. (in: a-proteobacteria)]|jgi:hypothetical protein|uniref:hypothetical protein n=1 Tax=Bosea sp. (in: a-proteobacteria) TaxID=1871050 RepID=UPI003F6F6025
MAEIENLDIEVTDVKQIVVSADPTEGAIVTLTTNSRQDIDLRLSPFALAKLEAFLVRANAEQIKHQTIQ